MSQGTRNRHLRYYSATVHIYHAFKIHNARRIIPRWIPSGSLLKREPGNARGRCENKGMRREARYKTSTTTTDSRLHFLHTRREKARRSERKRAAWKARDRKQKSDTNKRRGGRGDRYIYDRWEKRYIEVGARKARRAKGGLGFPCGCWKNICIYPAASLPPISAAWFLDIGSCVSIFRSFASRSDFRTASSLHFFLPHIHLSLPIFCSLSPSLSPFFAFISARAPVSISISLFCFSRDDLHSLALFSSRWRNVHQKIWILRRALSTTAFLELSAIVPEWWGDKGRN